MNLNATREINKTAKFEFGTVPVGAYVFHIAENKANDLLAKKIKRSNNEQITDPTEGYSAFTQIAAPQDFGTRLFENQNLVSRLLAKLKAEKPQYEPLIRLRFYEDMPYKDMAASGLTVYTSEESCKSHTSRAVKKLLEYARAEGVFHYDK